MEILGHTVNPVAIGSGKRTGVKGLGELKAESEAKHLEFTNLRLQLMK